MKWMAFKVILFCAVFIFSLQIIFPWMMSINAMPIWLAILLLSMYIVTVLIQIERLTLRLVNSVRKRVKLV